MEVFRCSHVLPATCATTWWPISLCRSGRHVLRRDQAARQQRRPETDKEGRRALLRRQELLAARSGLPGRAATGRATRPAGTTGRKGCCRNKRHKRRKRRTWTAGPDRVQLCLPFSRPAGRARHLPGPNSGDLTARRHKWPLGRGHCGAVRWPRLRFRVSQYRDARQSPERRVCVVPTEYCASRQPDDSNGFSGQYHLRSLRVPRDGRGDRISRCRTRHVLRKRNLLQLRQPLFQSSSDV